MPKMRGGYTPLHIAAQCNADKLVSVLVQNGAITDTLNTFGESPEDIAQQKEHDSFVRILRQSTGSTGLSNVPDIVLDSPTISRDMDVSFFVTDTATGDLYAVSRYSGSSRLDRRLRIVQTKTNEVVYEDKEPSPIDMSYQDLMEGGICIHDGKMMFGYAYENRHPGGFQESPVGAGSCITVMKYYDLRKKQLIREDKKHIAAYGLQMLLSEKYCLLKFGRMPNKSLQGQAMVLNLHTWESIPDFEQFTERNREIFQILDNRYLVKSYQGGTVTITDINNPSNQISIKAKSSDEPMKHWSHQFSIFLSTDHQIVLFSRWRPTKNTVKYCVETFDFKTGQRIHSFTGKGLYFGRLKVQDKVVNNCLVIKPVNAAQNRHYARQAAIELWDVDTKTPVGKVPNCSICLGDSGGLPTTTHKLSSEALLFVTPKSGNRTVIKTDAVIVNLATLDIMKNYSNLAGWVEAVDTKTGTLYARDQAFRLVKETGPKAAQQGEASSSQSSYSYR